jgi:hypothetical protein
MDTLRRNFLRFCAMATATAASAATPAWANRIRVLGDVGEESRLIAIGQPSPSFQQFMKWVRLGPSQRHGALTVFWLHGTPAPPAIEVTTLEEGRAQGTIIVTERAQASVPDLIVENRGKTHALLLAGEILVGGKQNRVLKEDVLLPPVSGPRNLGVYCVEQGRWNTGRADFDSKSTLAAPSLRSRLMQNPDQAQVWAEVQKSARAARAASPTANYQEIYENPEVKEHLKDVDRSVSVAPPPGALGAAVFVGSTLSGLDLFQPGTLFGREWPKLLRAYALEAYRYGSQPVEESKLAQIVNDLADATTRATGTLRGNAGVGQIFEFAANGRSGAALLFENRVIHTTVL